MSVCLLAHVSPKSHVQTSRNLLYVLSAVCGIGNIYAYESRAGVSSHKLEMWANAQRDGRPVEYRWRLALFNAAVWLCSNAAKTRNPLKFAGVPQTKEKISAAGGPKFTIL